MKNKRIKTFEEKIYDANRLIDFLESKGFRVSYINYYPDDSVSCLMLGCTPEIRVEMLIGNFRNDTETRGCICADFSSTFNKVSSCPIYFCENVKHEKLWDAIELMMNAGEEWSMHGGKIKEGNGYLFCVPSINDSKAKYVKKVDRRKK